MPKEGKKRPCRVLIVGRSGSGKSSLINGVLKEDGLAEVCHDDAGKAEIDQEFTSKNDERFILHDSQGYEPGNYRVCEILDQFIKERGPDSKRPVAEKIDVIWLLITVPYAGSRLIERGDEYVMRWVKDKIPVVVVFTKNDLMIAAAKNRIMQENNKERGQELQKHSEQVASKRYNEECLEKFKEITTHPLIDIAGKLTDHALIARTRFSRPAIFY
ncbi:hypothetical protein F5887DRAFT_968766 [Amanita rubescens]|nr:hypothetical protein F5887DRAFT_968766 [Amanita rubescens]